MSRKGLAERNERVNEAKVRIRKEMEKMDKSSQLYIDLKLVVGLGIRGGASSQSPSQKIRNELLENGFVEEMDLFINYQWGQPKMSIWTNEQIKNKEGSDRLWIKYIQGGSEKNKGMGIYALVATGDDVPEGWDGYIPAEMKQL